MMPMQNMNRQPHPGFHPNQFQQQSRNPLDPYGHLVVQQQRMQGGEIFKNNLAFFDWGATLLMRSLYRGFCYHVVGTVMETSPNSMLAQQLGRPLNQQQVLVGQQGIQESSQQQQQQQHQQQMMQTNQSPQSQSQGGQNGSLAESSSASVTSPMQADHQELPDNVTAELEKLEQEQVELADLGMDDDELLGMGADFNILEYADPELDQVVGGEKTNILDNLDLEEEEKEEKEQKRKEEPERYGFLSLFYKCCYIFPFKISS
jgi:hypothetical protein